MFTSKSVLLERINVAISKKWCQNNRDNFTHSTNTTISKDQTDLNDKDYLAHSKNVASIERLEQRIEMLENQNDQLLYFIDFLIENLPSLVINILHSKEETFNNIEYETCNIDATKKPLKSFQCAGKENPCPTRREMDVLELLVKGFCAKEIAKRLFISETTVITHKKNLKEKYHARNTVELISKAQPHLSKKIQ